MNRLSMVMGLLAAVPAFAQWPSDAGVDVPVATVTRAIRPSVVVDSRNGVYVIWASSQTGTNDRRLRGERFSLDGMRLWTTANADGGFVGRDLLGLSLGTELSSKALAVGDGDGGVIAIYTAGMQPGPYSLHGQRFDATGTASWATTGTFGGVTPLVSPRNAEAFMVVPDGLGGALVAVIGINDEFGHRFSATGALSWGVAGHTFGIGQLPDPPYAPQYLAADRAGGFSYIWAPSGSQTQAPAIAHVNAAGTRDLSVAPALPLQSSFGEWSIAGNPNGTGLWAAVAKGSSTSTVILQRFGGDGGTALDAGFEVPSTSSASARPALLDDGAGGVVMIWQSQLGGVNSVLLQRFGPAGNPLWGANPVIPSSAISPLLFAGNPPTYRMLRATDGSLWVFWRVQGGGIWASRVAFADGSRVAGPPGGFEVTRAQNVQWFDIAADPANGAFLTYQSQGDQVFLKRVNADGSLGTAMGGMGGGAGGGSAGGAGGGSAGGAGGGAAGGSAGGSGGAGGGTAGGASATGGGTMTSDGGTGGGGTPTDDGCGCNGSGGSTVLALAALVLRRRK